MESKLTVFVQFTAIFLSVLVLFIYAWVSWGGPNLFLLLAALICAYNWGRMIGFITQEGDRP